MNDYCIILAGGAGRRLWPYSTAECPKQFIDFFGSGRTLLQMTYDRFLSIIPADHIYVSTHADYVDLVKAQLPDLPAENIVAEDARLSTAPAAARTTHIIYTRDKDACIVATPADQVIINEDTFRNEVVSALQRLRVTAVACFMALAVQATHPYTSYGYIQKGETLIPGLHRVKTFTEKPDRDFAEMFVQSDEFLWNTGLFLWHVKTMHNLSTEILEEVQVQKLDELLLDKHREEVLVQECHFGWTDVGCWSRMHEVNHKDVDGNVLLGSHEVHMEGCSGNTLALESSTRAIVKGLKDYLISYKDGILVIIPNNDDAALKRMQNALFPPTA